MWLFMIFSNRQVNSDENINYNTHKKTLEIMLYDVHHLVIHASYKISIILVMMKKNLP